MTVLWTDAGRRGSVTLEVVPIGITTPSTVTIYTPAAGKRFAVYLIHLLNPTTNKLITCTINSGSTALTGTMDFKFFLLAAEKNEIIWRNAGMPVLIGDQVDEVLSFVATGTGSLRGFAVVDSVDF